MLASATCGADEARADALRVCADPNNLPFSNARGEGFENRIAEGLAHAMGRTATYTFWAQRRGFVRSTLKAGTCDVIIGVPAGLDSVAHVGPLYRSRYVFVQRAKDAPISSFDDPRLRRMRVGVQLVGDDGANTPPAHALARRGIVDNVRGFMVQGDYEREAPLAEIVNAVRARKIDVALVWGPIAGYFARGLRVTPVAADDDAGLPLAFTLDIGLRHGEPALEAEIGKALPQLDVESILTTFHVPR